MSNGTSWTVQGSAPGTDGYRIRLALERGDVRWNRRTTEWLAKHFDRSSYGTRVVNALLRDHVQGGGRVRGQRGATGDDHDVWFNVEIEMAAQLRFIKFVIEPEDDDNPGLVIVSAHPPH